ncbi:hypothetical protein EV183_002085 [Coemansia sp. RSA 2336]|nr:hypothetical protein EV183_002085 [Coemansia sp. RSA 2336]
MANFARAMQLSRPDSRSSQYSSGGRFNSALSAAVKQQKQQHTATSTSAEEQLEEVEQKITLTLQAIDANFDHCQRTMARDVMPKVETLARLSNDLLQASQPWLQFFMAVASADDNEEPSIPSATRMSTAQRNELEEQAAKGDITARFPKSPVRETNDETESIDLDAEIATPQLTSRFMTQELKLSTPRVGGKRMAEQLSASIRKRARGGGTPMKQQQSSGNSRTPASMIRALVNTRAGKHPGSAASAMSKNSSVGTSDLMPETSPPHTTTFTLPKSRIAGKAPATTTAGLPEDEDEDDDILDEINSLIRRYDSPKGTRSSVKSSMRSARSMQSVARSDSSYSQEMTQLADKYASPALDAASSAREVQRVRGLVADMEEMLDEAEASAAAAKAEDTQQENSQAQPENDDDDDELPSPPKITSDLEQSRVVVPDTYERGGRANDVSEAREHNGPRNFGARQPMMMDIEEMDSENMTIGHMSPLALRQRQQQQRAATGTQFSSLQESDEDDPFGPTPARPSAPAGAQRPWANASSARSLQERGWTERAPESTTRSVQEVSWSSGALGERSSTFDATATFGSPESDLDPHTRDSRLNASASLVPIDGTTTILPTREMLQQAAEASEAIIEDDDDDEELVAFDAEQFPPAFREAPAAQQLRALYDLVCSERERLWKLEDLVGAGLEPLEGVQPSVYGVLLDLLARRRVLRQVADDLWTAH